MTTPVPYHLRHIEQLYCCPTTGRQYTAEQYRDSHICSCCRSPGNPARVLVAVNTATATHNEEPDWTDFAHVAD